MKIIFIFLSTLVISTRCLSYGTIDLQIQNYIENNSIKQGLIYVYECYSDNVFFDTCNEESRHYLFYSNDEKHYVVTFQVCSPPQIFSLDSISPLSYFFQNETKIRHEKLKSPAYTTTIKLKNGNKVGEVHFTTRSHSCYHQFFLITDPDNSIINVDSYDIETKRIEKHPNESYYYNKGTRTYKLIKLTEGIIKDI